jgi:F5/8 type C domain
LPQQATVTELQFDSAVSAGRGGRGAPGAPAAAGRGGPGGAAPVVGYPRGYSVQVSADGTAWSKPVAEGKGGGPRTTISFAPVRAKFVRLTQTGSDADAPAWSIRNLRIYEAPVSGTKK